MKKRDREIISDQARDLANRILNEFDKKSIEKVTGLSACAYILILSYVLDTEKSFDEFLHVLKKTYLDAKEVMLRKETEI